MPAYNSVGSWSGLEYNLIKDGGEWPEDTDLSLTHGSPEPLTWETIEMEFPDPTHVQGYRVKVRYFEATVVDVTPPPPDGGGTNPADDDEPQLELTITYPAWTLDAQELQRAEEKFYFENETGSNLFAGAPGPQGESTAGIKDVIEGLPAAPENPNLEEPDFELPQVDNRYSYCRIFDQAELDWIPRCSPASQPPLSGKNANFPSEPYEPDANPPRYPIDGIVSFIPDEREIVNVTYELTTTYNGGQVEKVIITHPVSQKQISIKDKLKGTMDKSYYGNNLPHLGLYEPEEPRVYNQVGRYRRDNQINEPFSMIQLTRKSYPWDVNTNSFVPNPEEP
tara:strand:+ start:3503 stop:4513 length:1011 start_codon:yes stop_codon:yes gene_type:complete